MRALLADTLAGVDHVPWDEFMGSRFRWEQGEHVSLIGPTGGGKTTFGLGILPMRSHRVVVATKPADPTLNSLRKEGYHVIEEWPPPPLEPRVVLWPRFRGKRDLPTQRAAIAHALSEIFAVGGWCVFVDELSYLCQMLRLDTDLRLIWQQGRALKITLVGSTQRPAWVPLELYSQATHLFFWRTNDQRDLSRIGGIGTVDPKRVRQLVGALREHDALYLNTRTGEMLTTRAEPRR